MADEIATFGGREAVQGGRDQFTDLIEGPRAGRAEERFQFGERELDRIEVRTVGRQKTDPRADPFDSGVHLGLFVHREVVEHDDVNRPQRRREDLLDIREAHRVVDRAVKDGEGCTLARILTPGEFLREIE